MCVYIIICVYIYVHRKNHFDQAIKFAISESDSHGSSIFIGVKCVKLKILKCARV